jgi:hypothetical protein
MSSERSVPPTDTAPLPTHIGHHKTATGWTRDMPFRPACDCQPQDRAASGPEAALRLLPAGH